MAVRLGPILECDICGVRWMHTGETLPERCANPKFRHRKWNSQGVDETVPPVAPKKRKRK